jgi:hypothetical protein
MGIFNSTKTRVEPVFQALTTSDQPWLDRLLALPSFGHRDPHRWNGLDLAVDQVLFGDKEKRLPAHPKLLEWLLENATDVTGKGLSACGPSTRRKRELLLARDAATLSEARTLLSTDRNERRWYVLEGPSCPDVFISTPDLVIVIEGKRTEAGPTTATTWMDPRHQMLRHMDGALQVAGGRTVLGFFIVVGENGGEVPALWKSAAATTISADVLTGSLPHRPEHERNQIARGFLGVTTWQVVCRNFGINEDRLPDKLEA